VVPTSGLVHINPLALLLAAVAGSLFAPLSALFLAAFASNKVQGFALMKGAGVIFLPVIMAYFVEEPLQFAFGLIPVYWPVKLFWALEAGQPFAWLYLFMSVVYQGGLIWLLLKRFNRAMHRA
jgi:fluoroquinolone transport system permease protein